MLNLGFDIDLDIQKTKIPFHFERKNECVHCGAKNSLTFVDKFGRETSKEINSYSHIKCKACGRIYSISWDKSKEDGKVYPSAVEFNIGKQFMNFVKKSEIQENMGIDNI